MSTPAPSSGASGSYPQSRVLDLTEPYAPPAAAAPVVVPPASAGWPGLPVVAGVSDADREQTEREVAEDRRWERTLIARELLALLAVVAIVLVRALWLL